MIEEFLLNHYSGREATFSGMLASVLFHGCFGKRGIVGCLGVLKRGGKAYGLLFTFMFSIGL